jgi:hypothetical protein
MLSRKKCVKKKCEKLKMNNILEVRHMKKLFKEDNSNFLCEEIFDWMITICDKQINSTALKDVPFEFESSSEEEEEVALSDHSSDEDTPEE